MSDGVKLENEPGREPSALAPFIGFSQSARLLLHGKARDQSLLRGPSWSAKREHITLKQRKRAVGWDSGLASKSGSPYWFRCFLAATVFCRYYIVLYFSLNKEYWSRKCFKGCWICYIYIYIYIYTHAHTQTHTHKVWNEIRKNWAFFQCMSPLATSYKASFTEIMVIMIWIDWKTRPVIISKRYLAQSD